jgi:hypothetical protein
VLAATGLGAVDALGEATGRGAPLISSFAWSPQPVPGAQRITASLDRAMSGASLLPRGLTSLMPRDTKYARRSQALLAPSAKHWSSDASEQLMR